jgi:hypothetical protein
MERRVAIGAGGASPFVVSSSGDALSVGFENLIFNGNQQPLRLWNKGFVTVNPIPKLGPGGLPLPIVFRDDRYTYPTPTGSPVFIIAGKNAFGSLPLQTPWHRVADPLSKGSSQGFGGVISNSDKKFYGLNFSDPNNNTDQGYPAVVYPTYINFCIFKNYDG